MISSNICEMLEDISVVLYACNRRGTCRIGLVCSGKAMPSSWLWHFMCVTFLQLNMVVETQIAWCIHSSLTRSWSKASFFFEKMVKSYLSLHIWIIQVNGPWGWVTGYQILTKKLLVMKSMLCISTPSLLEQRNSCLCHWMLESYDVVWLFSSNISRPCRSLFGFRARTLQHTIQAQYMIYKHCLM